MKTKLVTALGLLLALAFPVRAAFDLRVTEIWPGSSGGNLTADWFEITNLGNTAWTAAGGPALYYDDDSFAAASAIVIQGLTDLQPGESVVVVVGAAADATAFRTTWQGSISLTGVEVGFTTSGAGLGQGGDGVGIWVGGPSGAPTHQVSFPGGLNDDSYDADLGAVSAVGNTSGAVANLSRPAVVASPGKTASGGAVDPNAPVVTVSATTTARLNLPTQNGGAVSGVISDPTDPAAQAGIAFALTDANHTASQLTLAAVSSNASVVPNANLVISGGTAATRTLRITPVGVGLATITVTVTDPTAKTDTYTIAYAVSAASSTPALTRYHTGASDASAAVPVGASHMLVANDEDQVLRLYERANSGFPVAQFNLNAPLALGAEGDLEAAVRIGNRVYWIGSHGNKRDGSDAATRRIAFSTDLTGSGAATVPVYVNKFTGLRTDMIAWDNANGHGLGAGALGLAASAASPVLPTVPNGFNIEGAALAPGSSTILLGFRAPLQNTTNRNLALVIPATNLTSVIDEGAGTVTFGAPIFLDLGGRAIRSMDTTATGQILILAGPVDNRVAGQEANTFKFFLWDGNAATAPIPLTSSIDTIAANANGGSPEAVFDLPATLVTGSTVGMLVDNGSTDHYATGQESKDLAANWQKFRADPVTLSAFALVVTTNANAGPGSLRQAIADAPVGSTITFAPALSGQTIPLTTGQLTLTKSVTIDASALSAGLTISGEDVSRIFEVTASQTVTLAGLTLREGFATVGGAIANLNGTLTVSGCTLLGNIAERGGAIFSNTDLSGQKTTLVNTTLTGNLATVGGGGVYNFDGLTEVRHCTITENSGPAGEGAGVASYGDTATQTAVSRSIITGNQGNRDVDLIVVISNNSFVSSGSNLVGSGDGVLAFNASLDVTAAVPLLMPLARYGGPTDTMPPLPASPAISRAAGSTTLTDQRGFPIVGPPDLGAYEAGTARTFAIWAIENIGVGATFDGDADRDGRKNGLEYATHTDPLASGSGGLTPVTLQPNGTPTYVTLPYRYEATDVVYELQRSTDLGAWTKVLEFDTRISGGQIIYQDPHLTQISADAFSITYVDSFMAGQRKVFYRLRVSVP